MGKGKKWVAKNFNAKTQRDTSHREAGSGFEICQEFLFWARDWFFPHMTGTLSAIALADKFADEIEFFLAGNGVGFGEFVPLDVEVVFAHQIGLLFDHLEWEELVGIAVADEKALAGGNGRKFFEQALGFSDATADADEAGETVRISQPNFPGHEAALGKTAEGDFLG